ncbi:MAG: amidohydrolase family protein [Lachnospiraceae bacterium]
MRIRFYNVKILTMEKDRPLFTGEVWTEENTICYIGKPVEESVLSTQEWDRQINGNGNLLMPGFKNAHTHSAMTFLRSYADDLPLQEWLHQQVFPMEAKLTPEDVYWLYRLAVMEYVTSGITAVFDMYFLMEPGIEASIDCGFRSVMCGALNDFCQSPEDLERWYEKYQSYHELISFCLGFHAEYTTSEPLLRQVAALSHAYQAPVFTHNSETEEEVRQCIQRNGVTPTVYLDQLGMFDYGGGGFHCVHMTEEDLDIFQKKGLSVVTNPASNMKLASGIAPISDMQKRGISLAIGTDGPASNNCLDMFREMFLTTALAKIREKDASVADADQVLFMATAGGAKAMGLTDCDVLAPGKKADMILLDLHQPNMQPENHITKNIVYSGSKQNVKMTMVNGRILYEDGSFFLGEEAEKVYRMANRIIERIRKE